jgi:hypothetical protein
MLGGLAALNLETARPQQPTPFLERAQSGAPHKGKLTG